MKVVFLMEAGIPSYRNFLFEFLNNHNEVEELTVLHTGKIYNGKQGNYIDKKVFFIGSNKLGTHIGILKYLRKADVIISSYNLRILTCWLPACVFKKKWIFWGKGLGENESTPVFYLRKFTSKWCRYILVYNGTKKDQLVKKLGIDGNKVIAYQNTVYISNAQDCSHFPKKSFLYFGRIQERKGLTDLISAYKAYVDEVGIPKYELKFVGDGSYKNQLIKIVEDNQLTKYVRFHPGVYNDTDIMEHFKNALIYVSPYNVGLAVVNSFAYGVPVLTCREPQVGPEFHYLNHKNSIIVDQVSDFTDIFNQTHINAMNFNSVSDYYNQNLHHSIMQENFIDTMLKIGK